MEGFFDGLDLRVGGVEIDCSGAITPEIIQEACDRLKNMPPPIPCGCKGNPHLVRPVAIGQFTNCVTCGWPAKRTWKGYRDLNSKEIRRLARAMADMCRNLPDDWKCEPEPE